MSTAHPFSFLITGWKHRRLIRRLAWRKIEQKYRGSVLGFLWALFHPLFMLSIYTFVFSFVFKARWNLPGGGEAEFALLLFSGLTIYSIFSDCVNEAPNLMAANSIFIKQLVFPTEVLAWVSLLASLFTFTSSMLLLAIFYVAVLGTPPWTVAYMPMILGPVLLLTLGMVWLLSSLGVFLRDISQLVGVSTTALLFMSPIFYSASNIPQAYRGYYDLNPFVHILEMSRASIFFVTVPDWQTLGGLTLIGWLVSWAGYAWFMKTKRSFPDVL